MEILIGIIGIILASITIKLTFFAKPKEELAHLKIQFKVAQKLSNQFKQELETFIEKHNVRDNLIFEGVKFGDYVDELKRSYEKNLSEELFAELDELKLTKPIIASMIKSLETQSESLAKLQIEIRLKDKQYSL